MEDLRLNVPLDSKPRRSHEQGPMHSVHFYHDEGVFKDHLFAFCLAAVREDEPLILLTTRAHQEAVRLHLAAHGYRWEDICAAGKAFFFDATETLTSIMDGPKPDRQRFEALMNRTLQPLKERAKKERAKDRRIRIFGELVDLLCREGNTDGAIRLEELWNDLARQHEFSLLCGYSMGNFHREINGSAYAKICAVHDHVTPASVAAS